MERSTTHDLEKNTEKEEEKSPAMYNAGSESSTRIDRRLHLKTSDRIRVSGGTTDREELFVFLFSERFPIQLYFNHQCSSNVHRKEEKIYLLGCFLKSVESKMVGSAEC